MGRNYASWNHGQETASSTQFCVGDRFIYSDATVSIQLRVLESNRDLAGVSLTSTDGPATQACLPAYEPRPVQPEFSQAWKPKRL